MAQLKVYKEPHHKIIYSNEFVRVIDLRLLPGDTTLAHLHDAASAVVFLTPSRIAIRDEGKSPNISDFLPGTTVYRAYDESPVFHTVWVEDHSPFRCLVVESVQTKESSNECKSAPSRPFQLLWMQKSIEAYQAQLEINEKEILNTQNCKYLIVVYSGKLTLDLNGSSHSLAPGEFQFLTILSNAHIEASESGTGLVLLKLK